MSNSRLKCAMCGQWMRSHTPTPKTPGVRRRAPFGGRCTDCPPTGPVSQRMYSKKALLLGEVETVDLFSVPLLLTVTSEHCGDPKCWCHSRTVKLYGTRVQEHLKNEDGSLTKNVLLEGDKGDCFMVSPWVVEKHAQDLGPLPTRYTILAND